MTRTALVSVVSILSVSGLALGQGAKPQEEPPARTGVLWLQTGDLDKYLVSPKDEALKRAVRMIPARLAELPGEIPDGDNIPPGVADLAARIISSPMRLGITYNPENQGGFMGAGVVLQMAATGEDDATRTAALFDSILETTPLRPRPSEKFKGMSEILTPLGMIRMGPRNTAKGWAYQIQAGTVGDADGMLGDLDAVSVPGVAAHTKMHFDAAPLAPFLDFFEMMAGGDPEVARIVAQVRESGVFGPKGLRASWVSGHAADRAVSVMTISGLGPHAAQLGMSRESLSPADLRVIPADAHWGTIGLMDPTYIRQQIDTVMASDEARGAIDQFVEFTGVNPLTDVFAQAGGKFAYYMSDATGGGGMMSMIVLASVADKAKVSAAIGKLAQTANQALAQPDAARGYASIRKWSDDRAPGCQFHSVGFHGVPMPLEVTIAFAGDWVVAGILPQAVVVAAKQVIAKGDGGILTNPRIADALPKSASFNSLSFADPARTIREGYPFVSMVGSAVANLVRSRDGHGDAKAARDPGMITPTYAELLDGARAGVSWATWDGDTYVYRSEGDRSALVQAAMTAGRVTPFLPALSLIGAGAAMGAQEERLRNVIPHPQHEDPMHEEGGPGF